MRLATTSRPREARDDGQGVHFAAGSSVEDNRIQFLVGYCRMPRDMANDEDNWAGLMDGSGWSPLHFLCQAVNRGHLLAEAGAQRVGLDLLGHPAAVVSWLRAGGCNLNVPVAHQTQNTQAVGFTALHLLAKPHHKWTGEQLDDVLALMEALLEQGASPDSELPGTGRTPLSLAATAGQEEVAVLLVKYGADPASPERDGSSVFARCRSGRQMPMLKALEEACRRRSRAAENQRARR